MDALTIKTRPSIHLRLTPHEKAQIEGCCAEKEGAEQLPKNPDIEIEEITSAVFKRWEWAAAVSKAVIDAVHAGDEAGADSVDADIMNSFTDKLSVRTADILPAIVRGSRVKVLVDDEANQEFFTTFRDGAARGEMRKMLPNLVCQHCPNSHVIRMWPGIHEAATIARRWTEDYPYFGAREESDSGDLHALFDASDVWDVSTLDRKSVV